MEHEDLQLLRPPLNPEVMIVMRYGGYWKRIPNAGRKKYEAGKQRSFKIQLQVATLQHIFSIHHAAAVWLANREPRLAATVPGSRPKQYVPVRDDAQLQSLMMKALEFQLRLEVFVSAHERLAEETHVISSRRRHLRPLTSSVDQPIQVEDEDDDFEDEGTPLLTMVRGVLSSAGTSTTSSVDDSFNFEGGDRILIENEEDAEDEADDCYSENEFQDHMSSDDDVSLDEVDMETADDQVDADESMMVFDTNVVDPVIVVGAKFADVDDLRHCLRQHSIKSNFNIKLEKSDQVRVVAICTAKGCHWRVRASRLADGKTFEIKKMVGQHTCSGVNKAGNNAATRTWLARMILQDVRENPNITPKEIVRIIDTRYSVQISYDRAWRGRERARELIFGNVEETYSFIPSLVGELIRRNPGSHIAYELEEDKAFQRVFVSFRNCINGFKFGCRPLLGVDGCHLRSKYLGTLLSATALDGNNGLYPVAFAIVEGEKEVTWQWFLNHLKQAFESELDSLTIISDQEKGLQEAVVQVFPHAEHRVCMRHLWKNFKKDFPGDFFERVVWDCARSFNHEDYLKAMKELRDVSEEAAQQLEATYTSKGYYWTRSLFSPVARNHYIVNNLSESFNAWILLARYLPALDLIDKIRIQIMEKMHKRKKLSEKWKGDLVPMADRYCKDLSRKLGGWVVRIPNDASAEVECFGERHVLDMVNMCCSCRRWQVTGLPCRHAGEVIGKIRGARWANYVDPCYHISRYKFAYQDGIAALPGKDQWQKLNLGYVVGPPHAKRPRGRPKKQRIRGRDEEEEGKRKVSKRRHKCTRCNGWGHHKNTCKMPINIPPTQVGTETNLNTSQGHPEGASSSIHTNTEGASNRQGVARKRGRGRGRGRTTTIMRGGRVWGYGNYQTTQQSSNDPTGDVGSSRATPSTNRGRGRSVPLRGK